MTPSDKKKVQLLVVLLLAAGAVWNIVYRSSATPAAQTVAATAAKGKARAKTAQGTPDSRIRMDLLAEAESSGEVGKKNIFQYRQKPLPPKPPEPVKPLPPPPPMPTLNTTPVTSTPIAPPPPPFKSFRYEGFSTKAGHFIGSVSEGGNTYQVTEGECLMGQYCIRRITEVLVEIEDLQLKRRQSFPRVQQ